MFEEINNEEITEVEAKKKTSKSERKSSEEQITESGKTEKTWEEWVIELGVNRAIAKGACSEAKLDWDTPIPKSLFEDIVLNFSKKGHGR